MATKRFRQKRRNTKRRKGGWLGNQNLNKSSEENVADWEKWNAKYPDKYPSYNPSMYYFSFNPMNMGATPTLINGNRKLKSQAQLERDAKNKRGFFDDMVGN